MSAHRAARPARGTRVSQVSRAERPRRSGRTRALLGLAAVAVLATGLSVKGTFAFWTDSATLNTGGFTSGTLDITLDGQLAGPGTTNNPGATTTTSSLALPNMVPGESVAYSFPVKNNGTTPLTYTLTGAGSGPLAVANGMQYSVTFGTAGSAATTAANSGSAAANNRAGTCGGVAATDNNTTGLLSSAAATTFGGTNRALAVGATEQVCIVARFSSAAGNGLQNQSGTTAAFLFDAKQVGAS